MVHALLSAGAKVNLQTANGKNPMHVACQGGHTEVACTLLSAGAKVDLQTTDGRTPLHVACQEEHTEVPVCALLYGHMGVVHALLSAGARADLCDISGRKPLDLLPCTLRSEVEHLVQQAKEERCSTRAEESRVGALSTAAPAAELPPSHYQSASPLQDGIEGSS